MTSNAAAAVRALWTRIMMPRLLAEHGSFAMMPANAFRSAFCYKEAPSDVLLRFQAQLGLIYEVYCVRPTLLVHTRLVPLCPRPCPFPLSCLV